MAKIKKKKDVSPYWPYLRKKENRLSGKGRVLTFDMEAVGLLWDIRQGMQEDLHTIVLTDKETGEVFRFFDPYKKRKKPDRVAIRADGKQDGYIRDGIHMMNTCDVLVGQNVLGYDFHAIDKAVPHTLTLDYEAKPRKKRRKDYPFRVMDTMVMSQLLWPDRKLPHQAYMLGKGNIGPHSIEAYGYKHNRPKPENEDWSHLTDHMLFRCSEDVEIGSMMFDDLMDEWYEQSEPHSVTGMTIRDAYMMEAFFSLWMTKQELNGFGFDLVLARKLCLEIDKKIEDIVKIVQPKLPLRIKMKKLNKQAVINAEEKANVPRKFRIGHKKKITHGSYRMTNYAYVTQLGHYSANTKKDYPSCVGNISDHKNPLVVGPYTPIVWEEVGLGNRDSVRTMLHEHGWRGVNLTQTEEEYVEKYDKLPYPYAGKIDTDSLEQWEKRDGEIPTWAKSVIDYYVLTHRRGVICNKKDEDHWIETGEVPVNKGKRGLRGLVGGARSVESGKSISEYCELFGIDYWVKGQFSKDEEFRVHGVTFGIGTNTFRCRHSVIVNIPSRGLYGKECRQLFIASKGYMVLGADGSGLELRMLSHFMKDKEYEDIVLNGDIHTHNQTKAGLDERDEAKRFIYAYLYGSGLLGLALICGYAMAKMQNKIDQFLEELPALKDLLDDVKAVASSRGYFKAVDGRLGRVRKSNGKAKEHTALNVLLQMTGSLCMKWGFYLAIKRLIKLGIEPRIGANQHDEVQMEVPTAGVLETTYKIPADKWKDEEKRIHTGAEGEQWSAPAIVKKGKKKITLRRRYHPAGPAICDSFTEAGKLLGIRTPLAGEYKISESWAGTH